MFKVDRKNLIEIRTMEGQSIKDYVCIPLTKEDPLESHFLEPEYVCRLEVRRIEDWNKADLKSTENVIYGALHRIRREEEETDIKTEYDIIPFSDKPKSK